MGAREIAVIGSIWIEEYKSLDEREYKRGQAKDAWMLKRCLERDPLRKKNGPCNSMFIQKHLSAIENAYDPVLADAESNLMIAIKTLDKIVGETHRQGNVIGALEAIASLPKDLRRYYVWYMDQELKNWLESKIGEQNMRMLAFWRDRITLNVEMDVETAIRMLVKYGRDWRDRARQMVLEIFETVV
jgi:hypothetical protein